MWVTIAETIRRMAKATLAVSSEKPKVNNEVHKKIKDKNKRFKELMSCTEEEVRIKKERVTKKQSG